MNASAECTWTYNVLYEDHPHAKDLPPGPVPAHAVVISKVQRLAICLGIHDRPIGCDSLLAGTRRPSTTCVVWLVRVELARVLCVADFFASNNVFRANHSLVNSDADSLSAADLVLAEEAVVAALRNGRCHR